MNTNSESTVRFLEKFLKFIISGSLLGTIVTFLMVILIVAFFAWFITKIAIETYDRHRKRYSSEELDLLKTEIQQLKNQLTCMIHIESNVQQLNKTVEGINNRIENTILYKNTPHM